MLERREGEVSRRSMLLVAGGAVAGLLAKELSGPDSARGADGDAVLLGRNNSATTETVVLTSGGAGLHAESTGGPGLLGKSSRWAGVKGTSTRGDGVVGAASARGKSGVRGQNPIGRGVQGKSNSGTGAQGQSTTGTGVVGVSSRGRGVVARSSRGVALSVEGSVEFRSAGVALVRAGQLRVRVRPGVAITSTTKVLATVNTQEPTRSLAEGERRPAVHLETPVFIWFVEPNPRDNTFEIVLTERVDHDVAIAWFVIS